MVEALVPGPDDDPIAEPVEAAPLYPLPNKPVPALVALPTLAPGPAPDDSEALARLLNSCTKLISLAVVLVLSLTLCAPEGTPPPPLTPDTPDTSDAPEITLSFELIMFAYGRGLAEYPPGGGGGGTLLLRRETEPNDLAELLATLLPDMPPPPLLRPGLRALPWAWPERTEDSLATRAMDLEKEEREASSAKERGWDGDWDCDCDCDSLPLPPLPWERASFTRLWRSLIRPDRDMVGVELLVVCGRRLDRQAFLDDNETTVIARTIPTST
ncbi:hypothetical protein ACHAXS_002294 [Conticribra weissflogii]